MKLAAMLILISLLGVFCITLVVAWHALEQQRLWEEEVSEAKANLIVTMVSFFIEESFDDIDNSKIVPFCEKTSAALGDTTISLVDFAEHEKPANGSPKTARNPPWRLSGGTQIRSSLISLNVAGTGQGLSIVDGINSEHGGEISVGSEPGMESVFRVMLPKYKGDPQSR